MNREFRFILATRIDATSYRHATQAVIDWAVAGQPAYVCAANVHMVIEGCDKPSFQKVVNEADLVTPDGMPLVWGLRWLGVADARRVYGPELMKQLCLAAGQCRIPVGLYGGTEDRLPRLIERLKTLSPALRIVYAHAPPFRPAGDVDDSGEVTAMVNSGARIVFVGLGCPKQELWMSANSSKIPAVLIGVGAAFDFHAGVVRQAPPLLQRAGLEWAFRLAVEPRRLWRRYFHVVPRFIWRFGRQLITEKINKPNK